MPVDPAPLNSVADLVLSDARAMRALTDPLRLTLFDLVRREGPITSNALAHRIDQDQETVDDHLRELASVGFVEEAAGDEGEIRWTTEAKGIYFEIPDEAEGSRARARLVLCCPYTPSRFSPTADLAGVHPRTPVARSGSVPASASSGQRARRSRPSRSRAALPATGEASRSSPAVQARGTVSPGRPA